MRVLVVGDEVRGCCASDGTGPIAGELATVLAVEHGDGGPMGAHTYTWHLIGLESGREAPTVEVVELDVARDVVVGFVHEALHADGVWPDDELRAAADALATAMLETADRYPIGTLLETRGGSGQLWLHLPAGGAGGRRPVCGARGPQGNRWCTDPDGPVRGGSSD